MKKKKLIKDDNIHIKISKDERNVIEKRASEEKRNISNYLLWLVSLDVEAHKDK